MADLLPTLPSDDEENPGLDDNSSEDGDDDEVDKSFQFGGILGEDGGLVSGLDSSTGWSYQQALRKIRETEDGKPQRMNVADLIAAKRRQNNVKVRQQEEAVAVENENDITEKEEDEASASSSDSESDSEEEVEADQTHEKMEKDQLKTRVGNDGEEDDEDESSEEEDAEEAAKAAVFFDDQPVSSTQEIKMFAQLTLSRPLLRGVAAMGFVQPTPIQAACIPVALQGRDICASAVTGSGKTAAFCLPVMEKLLHFQAGRLRAVILTPTRELAAQCLGMLTTLAQFTKLRATLITGGTKNSNAQAADLRSRPDIVVATPGRLLDHVTNTPGVTLEDVEFLILDECDRLLDLGFQDEVHEIVKACPVQRQTLLFSATLTTGVDDLIQLSLKRPVRIRITDKKDHKDLEVAPRLEQEFVRIQSNNEGINRQGILLALLTRTFNKQTIVFFDTKAVAHRMMILCGLCGLQCAELHGNLTQQQRLQALEDFTEGKVDILLATDLAARGLDIKSVQTVINFEMPSQVETYIHRIGRTARAGRSGRSCTLIGEGRRHLMKDLLKDASQKKKKLGNSASQSLIRTRSLPPSVIAHFVQKIESLEEDLEEILQAEEVARMDRIAEMEAIRAQNIVEHSAEINARPAKEWFASKKQKEMTKKTAAEKKQRLEEQAGTGVHRMTRKKRRRREVQEAMEAAASDSEEETPRKGRQAAVVKSAARAAKKQKVADDQKYFQQSLYDIEKDKELKQKQKKKRAKDASGDSSIFDDEKVAYSQPSKKVSEKKAPSAYTFRGYDPDRKLGKKKGHKKFKSKAKHKRRK